MAGGTNFLEFNPGKTNIESDAAYLADTARLNGVGSGQASSQMHNKLFRQMSVMVAALAQFIANNGQNASDTDLTALTTAITNSFVAQAGTLLDTGKDANTYVWANGVYKCTTNVANMPVASHNWIVDAVVYDASNITLYASDLSTVNAYYQRQKIGGAWQAWLSVGGAPANASTSAAGIVQLADAMTGTPVVPVRITRASNVVVSVTTAQTVLSFTPTAQGNFIVYFSYRVITGTTNVTLTITYTDSTGAQTNTVLNAQSSPVGTYSCIPVFINTTNALVTVAVTASVANRVYVSSSIVGV